MTILFVVLLWLSAVVTGAWSMASKKEKSAQHLYVMCCVFTLIGLFVLIVGVSK